MMEVIPPQGPGAGGLEGILSSGLPVPVGEGSVARVFRVVQKASREGTVFAEIERTMVRANGGVVRVRLVQSVELGCCRSPLRSPTDFCRCSCCGIMVGLHCGCAARCQKCGARFARHHLSMSEDEHGERLMCKACADSW